MNSLDDCVLRDSLILARDELLVPLLGAPSMVSDESQKDLRTCIMHLDKKIELAGRLVVLDSEIEQLQTMAMKETFVCGRRTLVMPVTGWTYPNSARGAAEAFATVTMPPLCSYMCYNYAQLACLRYRHARSPFSDVEIDRIVKKFLISSRSFDTMSSWRWDAAKCIACSLAVLYCGSLGFRKYNQQQ